jgi:hypothetical protein
MIIMEFLLIVPGEEDGPRRDGLVAGERRHAAREHSMLAVVELGPVWDKSGGAG